MSMLGYSSAYFLPQYWVNTPLYGEKIIPLLDYILSSDYMYTDKLATAFYSIADKYKNSADLPIDRIEAIIEESGYGYIRNLLGDDEESLKLLVYILVMIHQLKGSKRGIETVLSLMKSAADELELSIVGEPSISPTREVSEFSNTSFVVYSNLNLGVESFEINFQIKTSSSFNVEQCIASVSDYGFYLGIDTNGRLVLMLGKQSAAGRGWQEIDGTSRFVSARKLNKNTSYYITLVYSGYDYILKVSQDGEKYTHYISLESPTPLDVTGGVLNIGIDRSTKQVKFPFKGTISLAPFSISSKNVKVTQWFEIVPVDTEDTFTVDAEVDISLISTNFFINFAKFVEKYVYPTLKLFRAKLALRSKLTFLPYVRQSVIYVASNTPIPLSEHFMAKDDEIPSSAVAFLTEEGDVHSEGDNETRDFENFAVQFPKDN